MEGAWFWMTPVGPWGQELNLKRQQSGEGGASTSPLSSYPGPQASTVQNPVIPYLGWDTPQLSWGLPLLKQETLWWS